MLLMQRLVMMDYYLDLFVNLLMVGFLVVIPDIDLILRMI